MIDEKNKKSHGGSPGNEKEDREIFDVSCGRNPNMEEEDSHEAMTSLRSELAALQYKRDRLLSELNDMKNQLRCRDQRTIELQSETENLKEQAARQNAIIASLRKRIQELEEKERALAAAHGRSEGALQTLQREAKYQEEKSKELAKRVRALEVECHAEEQAKSAARGAMSDFVRRLANALGIVETADAHTSQECLVHKAAELVQETSRLRSRSCTMSESLNSVETELRSCREALERAVADRDNFQRQAAGLLVEMDGLKQQKEELEIRLRMTERESSELKEKLAFANKSLGCANVNNAAQETSIQQLKEECKTREERAHRFQNEHRHLLETLAISLSTPARFVESTEEGVKNRIREIVQESKEKCMQIESLKEKVHILSGQLGRQSEIGDQVNNQIRHLEDEKALLEARIAKMEEDFQNSEVARESLRRDKTTFMTFLERLGRALNADEIAKDVGVDLHTESLLLRAEQLARLETDKIVDKTSAVYQLQRKIRTLREQLQRKDLHLDLLRRKLALQEENCRVRSAIAMERDEAQTRCKKLVKQVERLQMQLADARTLSQDLKNQLAEAGDFKIAALERGRKVEELQKRLVDSEMLRNRYNRKIALLKEQVRATSQSADQERTISEHSLQLLRDDLANAKLNLAESTRRETQLLTFRASVCKILGIGIPVTDYEIVSKLEKLAAAHREFTLLSRRYDDPMPAPSPGPTRTPRYEDSGFLDQPDLSALEDGDDVFHKRCVRNPHPSH